VNHQTVHRRQGQDHHHTTDGEQIEKMTALVRETIGFNKDRGDSVNLMNAPFAIEKPTVTSAAVAAARGAGSGAQPGLAGGHPAVRRWC
jgi:flagellar biosynthesis/type III secretory pathway M-ring protein FliF/YscJ